MTERLNFLVLVRHSVPAIDPNLPPSEWHLSREGKERTRKLSSSLAPFKFSTIYSSIERKAVETADILAETAGVPSRSFDGLHEHERYGVKWSTQERFEKQVAAFFERTDELVFGGETGDQARSRFANALHTLRDHPQEEDLVVVTHGTVMTLFIASYNDIDPFKFWRSLKLPSIVVLRLPGYKIA